MARRKLQVGDDLSSRKLYFTVQASDEDSIWDLTATDTPTFVTTTLWSWACGYNSYSLGTRYYSGVYSPNSYEYVWGDTYMEWPEHLYLSWSSYSGDSMAVESGPEPYMVMPSDFGAIYYLNTSSPYYNFLEIDDSDTSALLYIGDSRVSEMYIGTQKIPTIFSAYGEIRENFFILNEELPFTFEVGQTWAQWIDQKKYWPIDRDNFVWSYDQYGVYFKYMDEEYNSTLGGINSNDQIILYHNYSGGSACLSGDTLIQTAQGNKSISTLEVGEQLDDNNVIEKIVKHNRKYYYEIILDNNDVIRASNDHQFICNNNIVKTEDLQINDKLSDLTIININRIDESLDMYEIKTSTNQYTLFNGIICESENI